MKTGFSKKCITPPLGSPIVGYYKPRFTKGVIDDLYVRAVAFDDGEKKAVCICFDLCLLPQRLYDEYRKMISDETGISHDAIFITCQHTHSGPLVGKDFASEKESSPEYENLLKVNLRDVVLYALQDLKPSRFFMANTEAKNISFCRRYRMKDGSVQTNPGVGNPEIDHVLASANEAVKVVKIVREGGNDICLINFGTHCDTVGDEYISADYPGYACDAVEAAIPGTECMFLLAPQGDVNHINPFPTDGEKANTFVDFDNVPRGIEHTKHMGRVLAGAVLSVYSIADEVSADKISFASKVVKLPSNKENDKLEGAKKICDLYNAGRESELPYKGMELTTALAGARRIIRLENGPEAYDYNLSAVRIGDFVIAGTAGEPFTEIATRIYENSPFKATILCCLSNSGPYVPTSKAYLEGGYEAAGTPIKMGADDIIVDGMTELLNQLK